VAKRKRERTPRRPQLARRSRAAASKHRRASSAGVVNTDAVVTPGRAAETPAPPRKRRHFAIEVVWGDATKVPANLYIVGHYQGVLPQNAEGAFDEVVSTPVDDPQRRVITSLTRGGVIRGALGDVFFVPWKAASVLIAGMGRPGTFGERQLRLMWRSVAHTIGRLADTPEACTVLVGSGAGTLSVPESVRGLVEGINEAFEADPDLRLERVKIIERDLDRAVEALKTLMQIEEQTATAEKPPLLQLHVGPDLQEVDGANIPDRFCYSVLSAAVARAGENRATLRETLRPLLDHISDERLRSRVADGLKDLSAVLPRGLRHTMADLRQAALDYRLRDTESNTSSPTSTRVSYSIQQNAIHVAAITHTVTVAERMIGTRPMLIERAAQQMIDPDPAQLQQYGRALSRFLIPSDFTSLFDDSSHLILEVDRQMATVPWEMLQRGDDSEPLAVRRPVARQLRTPYSARPPEFTTRPQLRALVIGDPAEPPYTLEESRNEARQIARLLEQRGFEVVLRIGAPEDGTGAGPIKGIRPADLLEVVDLLASGEFDLVHYSGHADTNDQFPEQTGWRFKDNEFLTPAELEALEQPPAIVVANACLSGQLGKNPLLVPSLADAFFKRGVYDYIGTSWQVKEQPAVAFAEAFYQTLFTDPSQDPPSATIGDAVQTARRALYRARETFGNAWGAYQHYGDPTRQVQLPRQRHNGV